MRDPTDALRDEHRVIGSMLDTVEIAANLAETIGVPPDTWWARAIEWLRVFADRNHHAKEERALFPAMVKAGVPADDGPISVMLEVHAQGRTLIQAMSAGSAAERASSARRYVVLLRDHIEKENGVLLPLAQLVLDGPSVAEVWREFGALEGETEPAASLACAEAVVKELRDALGSYGLN